MKNKIQSLIDKISKKLGPYKKNIIIPLIKILAIIIVCAVIVRYLTGRETLADYANKHPEIAYPTVSVETDK